MEGGWNVLRNIRMVNKQGIAEAMDTTSRMPLDCPSFVKGIAGGVEALKNIMKNKTILRLRCRRRDEITHIEPG